MAAKLPDIMSGPITFENILSIRVLEWLVILVGCKIKGINELEARKLKEGRKEGNCLNVIPSFCR